MPEDRIMEPEETSITRQRLSKHVPAATNTQATIEELLEAMFSVGSAPRLYNEKPRPDYKCGGGVEYLHRDPASRRRRRNGKSQI
jgi:hypothetical protein